MVSTESKKSFNFLMLFISFSKIGYISSIEYHDIPFLHIFVDGQIIDISGPIEGNAGFVYG